MHTKILTINSYFPDVSIIEEASSLLKKGKLVVFPTETVYGIGVDSNNKEALEKLYLLKKRPKDKPFTYHIADLKTLDDLKVDLPDNAKRLISKFWPGPLTIIAFNDKKETVGLRMPDSKVALDLIKESGLFIVAPSANISGETPPITGEEAISNMDGLVDMVLDGGETALRKESTIVDVTETPFNVIREGAIYKEDILAKYHVLFVCTGNSCRSVMAEGLFRKFLQEADLSREVIVDSAGTGGYNGIPAQANTIASMKEEGVDVSLHEGKAITKALLKKQDYIFVMEDFHKKAILDIMPDIAEKALLLKEEGVDDPIGKSLGEYRKTLNIIKKELENILLDYFKKN